MLVLADQGREHPVGYFVWEQAGPSAATTGAKLLAANRLRVGISGPERRHYEFGTGEINVFLVTVRLGARSPSGTPVALVEIGGRR